MSTGLNFDKELKRLEEIHLEMIRLQRENDAAQGNAVEHILKRIELVAKHWELDREAFRINLDMRKDTLADKLMKILNSKDDQWGDVCQCHRGTNKVYREIPK